MEQVYFLVLLPIHSRFKRLTVKDKSLPTPINFYRVDILLSSTVDSCCFGTVRIFNIISLYFREQGETKTCYSVGRWQAGLISLAMGR
jgi:hypothetical protein